ncbi:unnamed protein product, partial [Scytosiphon promiscuus]
VACQEQKSRWGGSDMGSVDHSPDIETWHRCHASQERERQHILGVLREFERRTPQRRGQGKGHVPRPSASNPSSPASAFVTGRRGGRIGSPSAVTASTADAAAATAPRLQGRPRPSVSPELPRRGPSAMRQREGGDVDQSPPPSAARVSVPAAEARGDGGPLWRGQDDRGAPRAMSSAPFSSQNSSSTATSATRATAVPGEQGRCSSSSCGVYSPVDIRSAGRGAAGGSLGLGSPPSGVLLFHDERADYSPPRPRAFWREKWHRECSCGGGGRQGGSCGTVQCKSRPLPEWNCSGSGGGTTRHGQGESSPSLAASGGPSIALAKGEAGRVRHGNVEGALALERRVGVTHYRRCCSNSSSFRDRRSVASEISNCEEKSGAAVARPDLSTIGSESRGVRESDPLRDTRREIIQGERPECTGDHDGDDIDSNGRGVSAAGLSLLAVVAIASFATGTIVGPPHRQHPAAPPLVPPPPPTPSASPTEYPLPLPSPSTYEPTLQEMMRTKTKKKRKKRKKKSKQAITTTVEESIGQTQSFDAQDVSATAGRGEDVQESSEALATTVAGASVTSDSTASTSGMVVPSGADDLVGDTQRHRNGSGQANGITEVEALVPEVKGCEGEDGMPLGLGLGGVADVDAAAPGDETASSISRRGRQEALETAFAEEHGWQETMGAAKAVPFVALGDGAKGCGSASQAEVGAESSPAASTKHGRVLSNSRTVGPATRITRRPLTSARDASSSSSSSSGSTAATSGAASAPGLARGGATTVSDQRGRRRREIGRSTAFGSSPAAFARTLGSAESSLAFLSGSGHDEQASRATALRAAMSEDAARSACRSLAWSKAGPALGGDRGGYGGECDTDAAWEGVQGSGFPGAASSPSPVGGEEGSSSGGWFGRTAAGRHPEGSAAAASAAAAADVPGVSAPGGRTPDSAHGDVGLDGKTSRDGDPGGRPSTLPSSVAAKASTTIEQSHREAEREGLLRSGGGGGNSSSCSSGSHVGAGIGSGCQRARPPRCRELVLSGKDVHASWAGRYVLVDAGGDSEDDDHNQHDSNAADREASEDQGCCTPHVQAPYYCLDASLAPDANAAAAVAGGWACLSREEKWEERGEEARTCPRLTVFGDEDQCPAGPGALSGRRSGGVLTAAEGEVVPNTATAVVRPELGLPKITSNAAASAAVSAAEDDVRPFFPGAPAVTAAATATTSASAAAYEPRDELGLSEAWEDGLPCLYWADLGDNGGRWVLDDDLILSNGVLAVTKDPVPAAADLAFVDHARRCQSTRTWGG